MRYWLSCDGGGTKLAVLLIDEELRVVCEARSGGINPNFLSMQSIRKHAKEALEGALAALPSGGEIQTCYVSMPGPPMLIEDTLAELGVHAPCQHVQEGRMGILAGLCVGTGFAALAGTGSDVFFEDGEHSIVIGGWGMLLGDEGSGTWIGQTGLQAAIRAHEGWGERTALEAAVEKWLDYPGVRWMGAMSPKVYQSNAPRAVLASFAPIVCKAANAGDAVAQGVLREAAELLTRQMCALIDKALAVNPRALELPATVCGGAWKGSPLLFGSYCQSVRAAHPQLEIHWPLYEAVAGGIVLAGMQQGLSSEEIRVRMQEHCAAYRYPKASTT